MTSRAFSLIELLTTIAIIMIIAGLMAPATSSILESSRSVRCGSAFRQLQIANLVYAGSWEGQWLPSAHVSSSARSLYWYDNKDFISIWTEGLVADAVNIKVPLAMVCPKSKRLDSAKMSQCLMLSFAPNTGMDTMIAGRMQAVPPSASGIGDVIAFADALEWSLYWSVTRNAAYSPDMEGYYAKGVVASRHRGRISFACFDGHVEARPRPEALVDERWLSP